MRPLDGTTARLIAGTEGAAFPFWSPDSKSVAFFGLHKLQRVDLANGNLVTVCDTGIADRGGAWTSNGRILFPLGGSLVQVPASGGVPSALTKVDESSGELSHQWPQVLPGNRFLYMVVNEKPENSGIYAASLARPGERVRLLTSDTNVAYAPGGDGKSYLLWLRAGALVAGELDLGGLKLTGEPRVIANPVARNGMVNVMQAAVSASGILLYNASVAPSQFTWMDRAGKALGTVGEPGEYTTFRLSTDGRTVAASRDRRGAMISGSWTWSARAPAGSLPA